MCVIGRRMTPLNDSSVGRRPDDSPTSSLVVRLLIVVLRCFVGALAVLYTAKLAAILTADQLIPEELPTSVADENDVIGTVAGSDVSELLRDAETPRLRQLSRPSVADLNPLSDDADVAFARLLSDDIQAFVWHSAGLQYRAVGQWGCGWRAAGVMALEDVGVLTFGIAVATAQSATRQLLNSALLQMEREHFFDALHYK